MNKKGNITIFLLLLIVICLMIISLFVVHEQNRFDEKIKVAAAIGLCEEYSRIDKTYSLRYPADGSGNWEVSINGQWYDYEEVKKSCNLTE